MIISDNRLFPYPVLRKGNKNFNSAAFEANVQYKYNEKEYEFLVSINLTDKNLINLAKANEVSILCHLECSKTKFRIVKELQTGENQFKVDVASLDGRLQLVALIVAKKDLEDYHSDDFDSDYEDNTFFIRKGNILGVAEIPPVFIENKKENNSSLPSIFNIRSSEDEEFMKVGYEDNRIMITLPIEEFKIRNANNNGLHSRRIMNSMIVFPTLVAILNEISKPESIQDYGNLRWFAVVNKKLKGLNPPVDLQNGDLENSDIFHVAQQLLEELFSEAMISVDYLEELEE
jgi:hypothetical protein